ncbi:MAG: hypothetical protein LLF92_11340 [Planctomycetaceae bacterium]|nr:hypothetical protein [Planctomycetaceae bacterium]
MSYRDYLTHLFGGVDKDIEEIFFNLSLYELGKLFAKYERKYGQGPAQYAIKTYWSWKEGRVTLSGQTAERLIELLPYYLSKEQRFELIKKLRKRYLKKNTLYIDATPESWREKVLPAIDKIIKDAGSVKYPDNLIKRATWLSCGDMEAVHRLLEAVEKEEAVQRTAYLEAEFNRIESFIANVRGTERVSHHISLPQGDIYVKIVEEKPTLFQFIWRAIMTDNNGNNEMVRREDLQKAFAIQQAKGSFLNLTFDELTESQKNELRKKIAEEKLGLDVAQAQADQRFYDSTRDMAATVQTVRGLEQSSKSDYEVRSTFNTASGNTNITVKKNTNTVIIVIAIVIGIIIFVLLRK